MQDRFEESSTAPPTEPGEVQALRPPESWPSAIGILGIIFAALGILGGACGVGGALLGTVFAGVVPEEARAQMEASMRYALPYPVLQWGVQFVELVLAIVLLVGSIQILRRSRAGRGTLIAFSWLDLVANFLGAGVGLFVLQAQEAMLRDNPDLARQAGALGPGAGMAMLAGGFILACVWPVFLIIWFNREKVRDDIDRWGEAQFAAL